MLGKVRGWIGKAIERWRFFGEFVGVFFGPDRPRVEAQEEFGREYDAGIEEGGQAAGLRESASQEERQVSVA
jgi:hypothetical protein